MKALCDGETLEFNDDYATCVSALPAAIIGCGLGQATATLLASVKSKERDPRRRLYDDMCRWLCGGFAYSPYPKGDLLDAIVSQDRRAYLFAKAEALQWLHWTARFAKAYLKQKPEESGEP